MSKKKHKKNNDDRQVGYGGYDPSAPDAVCIFCSTEARYHVEYECGKLGHRHPNVATCKACTWLLSQLSGGQFTIQTKAFDGREELAQMKCDALNAVEELLEQGRVRGDGHTNEQLHKMPPRLERDIWGE